MGDEQPALTDGDAVREHDTRSFASGAAVANTFIPRRVSMCPKFYEVAHWPSLGIHRVP